MPNLTFGISLFKLFLYSVIAELCPWRSTPESFPLLCFKLTACHLVSEIQIHSKQFGNSSVKAHLLLPPLQTENAMTKK